MTTANIVGASMNHRSCFEEKKPQNSEGSSIYFSKELAYSEIITKKIISHVKWRHFYDIPKRHFR